MIPADPDVANGLYRILSKDMALALSGGEIAAALSRHSSAQGGLSICTPTPSWIIVRDHYGGKGSVLAHIDEGLFLMVYWWAPGRTFSHGHSKLEAPTTSRINDQEHPSCSACQSAFLEFGQ